MTDLAPVPSPLLSLSPAVDESRIEALVDAMDAVRVRLDLTNGDVLIALTVLLVGNINQADPEARFALRGAAVRSLASSSAQPMVDLLARWVAGR